MLEVSVSSPVLFVLLLGGATIVDANNPNAARDFAARFFGDQADNVVCVTEEYKRDEWSPSGSVPQPPPDANFLLKSCLEETEKTDCNAPHLSRVALRKSGKKVCFRGLRESVMPS